MVGAELAAHCRPVKLEDGELTIEAESTAWATQLRLLAGKLLGRIAGEVGRDVVDEAEHPRPGRTVLGQGPEAGTGPRPPRHLRLSLGADRASRAERRTSAPERARATRAQSQKSA